MSDPNSSRVSGSTRWSKCPAPISLAATANICTGRVIRFARYNPIHVDDYIEKIPYLLGSATADVTTTNFGGSSHTSYGPFPTSGLG